MTAQGKERVLHSFFTQLLNFNNNCCHLPIIEYCVPNCMPALCSKEKAMAPHSSTLAWKIPWTEEPGRLKSMGSLRVGTTERLHFHFSLSCIGEGNGDPLQYSCLENPTDRGAWWATVHGAARVRHNRATEQQQHLHVTPLEPLLIPAESSPGTCLPCSPTPAPRKAKPGKRAVGLPQMKSG